MSATIVQLQKSSTNVGNSHYFECGDIFQTVDQQSQQQQQQQQQPEIGLDAVSSLMLPPEKDLHQHQQQHQHNQMQLQQQQQAQAYRLHGALTRTISQPAQAQAQARQSLQFVGEQQQQQQQQQQVASLVTIIENLGSMNLHRKLERTQSEPLPPQQPMNTSRYKTELCRPFEEAGECKYGEKCQFAHGYHELRNLQRHPKYKTEPCRTFHSKGLCPYGPRCHFVHNADEARASQQQQQQPISSSNNNNNSSKQINNNNSSSNNNNNSSSQGVNGMNQFFLPLSPPLSMSTGSDRESPTGSLSLSPTNSLTNFPFSSEAKQQQQQVSSFFMSLGGASTPPESPHTPISPVHTPPPYGATCSSIGSSKPLEFLSSPQLHHQQHPHQSSASSSSSNSSSGAESGKQMLQKSISSPLHIAGQSVAACAVGAGGGGETEAPRLPVFNRLSSAVDAFQLQSNLGL